MDWMHYAIRSLAAIFMLFVITRILGKKQISQLTFFEYITGITIGDLAGFISTDIEAHFMHGAIGMILWAMVPLLMEKLTLKSKRLRDLFEGTETVVIRDGKILENNLKKERYTTEELLEELRGKNVFRVADVEFAVLETTGDLSVLLKKEHQPVTNADMGITAAPEKPPVTLITDGVILKNALDLAGYSREWLCGELQKRGLSEDEVFLAQVDSYGCLYIDLFDSVEKTVPLQVNAKQELISALLHSEALLNRYGSFSLGEPERSRFLEASHRIRGVLEDPG